MKDKIFEVLSHDQGTFVAVIICTLLIAWSLGCQVTTENPFSPGDKVTKAELDILAEEAAQKLSLAYDDIERQEQVRKAILEAGRAFAESGGIDPLGFASTLLGIVGIGGIIDNRRKDAVIKSKTKALEAVTKVVEYRDDANGTA